MEVGIHSDLQHTAGSKLPVREAIAALFMFNVKYELVKASEHDFKNITILRSDTEAFYRIKVRTK